MGIGPFGTSSPLFLRNGELLEHSPMHNGNGLRQNIAQKRFLIIYDHHRVTCNDLSR